MGRFYLTTPIYYVNDAPHIGHAYATVLGDAVCRWHRLLGDDTFYLTGTDEHGLKVARAAEANAMTPREWADVTVERFRDAWRLLGIANDDFIRTTEPRHYAAVAQLLQACYDAGDIVPGTYRGRYCVSCEAYYVEAELIDGELCPVHRRAVEWVEEENWFFRLSRFGDILTERYTTNPGAVQPDVRRNEVLGFIRGGLQDFSISRRSLRWGIPLPWDPSQVTYVWFDALANYITAAGYGSDPERFGYWWPADVHLIGKDILRFHAVYWPAMLLSAGLEPPRKVLTTGFLLVKGEKMAKTGLNQIAPAELVADFGVDGFRYFFLREYAVGPDGDFSYENMVARYNADLANNLGNLLARVAAVVHRACGGTGPAPRPAGESPLAEAAASAYEATATAWANLAPNEALEATWSLVRATNSLLEATEPWKAEPGPAVDGVLGDALEALRLVAIWASPAIPTAAGEVWRRIGLPGRPEDALLPEAAAWGGYPGGLPVTKGTPLFPRLATS